MRLDILEGFVDKGRIEEGLWTVLVERVIRLQNMEYSKLCLNNIYIILTVL